MKKQALLQWFIVIGIANLTERILLLMPSYKLVVEYNGLRYNGFQRQTATAQLEKTSTATKPLINKRKRPRNCDATRESVVRTVQDCLEEALAHWTELSIPELRLRAAGRTDKGVHATGQVVAVDISNSDLTKDLKGWQMCRALNSRLPYDVSVRSMTECDAGFEPRHDATRKQYTYTMRFRRLVLDKDNNPLDICNSGPQTLRTAHDSDCLWICPWPLKDSLIKDVCNSLVGKHDFSCFVHKSERSKKDNAIELKRFDVDYLPKDASDNDDNSSAETICNVKFKLEASGFRRSMVRNLVGFVVDVCRGLLSRDEIPKVLTRSNERASIVHSAPASGLCLSQVVYETEE